MKFNSLQGHFYTGNAYAVTVTTDTAGERLKTYALEPTTFTFAGGDSLVNTRLVIYSKSLLNVFDRIDNLRDRTGALIVPLAGTLVGALYEVKTMNPVLNVFGYAEGYKYTLVRVE